MIEVMIVVIDLVNVTVDQVVAHQVAQAVVVVMIVTVMIIVMIVVVVDIKRLLLSSNYLSIYIIMLMEAIPKRMRLLLLFLVDCPILLMMYVITMYVYLVVFIMILLSYVIPAVLTFLANSRNPANQRSLRTQHETERN
jgi:hypothetical protein